MPASPSAAQRRASGPPMNTTSAGCSASPAGVAGEQPVQVAPHHHAAQAPVAPEGAGVAQLHLDHRAALPGAERPRQRLRQAPANRRCATPSSAARRRRTRSASKTPPFAVRRGRRPAPCSIRVTGVLETQPVAEIARQVVGQRMHGLAEEILQLRDLVGDAAVIVDQVPQRHALRRPGTTGLRSSSGRPPWRRRRRPAGRSQAATVRPAIAGSSGAMRVHPLADRHRLADRADRPASARHGWAAR